MYIKHNPYIYLNPYHTPQSIVEIDLAFFLKFTTIVQTIILTVVIFEIFI